METVDSCSEWMFSHLGSFLKGRPRLWLRDPDRLLSGDAALIQQKLKTEHRVFVAGNPLALRFNLREGVPAKWLLVDQTRHVSAGAELFAPDLKSLVQAKDVVQRTIRDYLSELSGDGGWPQDVESYPYRELARDNPAGFLRAFEDFRTTKAIGFSNEDLLLIGASAVLRQNLFALDNALDVLRLAFHSGELWRRLEDYFAPNDIEAVRAFLRGLRTPLGALFGGQAQSARLATVALIVLSRHLENPAVYLPHISPGLSVWQDCDPIAVPPTIPPWFQTELDEFDKSLSDGFIKTMRHTLQLDVPVKAKEFLETQCWSRRLREVALIAQDLPTDLSGKPLRSAKKLETVEALLLELRPVRDRLQRLVRELKPQCERLRNLPLSTLPIEPFIKIFRERGLCRLPLLRDQLSDLANRATSLEEKPPGFDSYWARLQVEIDGLHRDAETVLRDFDFALGRWCEARWIHAVPKEIATTNLVIERFIAPRRVKAPKTPLAILLLDGLRYDLWHEVVRPHLEQRYEVDESVSLATLPSETHISRFGFFAGLSPKEYFGKTIPGGEVAACSRLFQRLIPGHPELRDMTFSSSYYTFGFASEDKMLHGLVVSFADNTGHAGSWDVEFLARIIELWVEKLDQLLDKLPKNCELWITTDHGQVISGSGKIEIPEELLVLGENGYRSALVSQKIPGMDGQHTFHLNARGLGYDCDGYWAFPKPGFSFRPTYRNSEEKPKFKPTASMRHGGLSAFEIFVPTARLRRRKTDVTVKLTPVGVGPFKLGVPGQIVVQVNAEAEIPLEVEISGNLDGLEPGFLSRVGPDPQEVHLPFTPAQPGTLACQLAARVGYKTVPNGLSLAIHVEDDLSRPPDDLDDKLRRLFRS